MSDSAVKAPTVGVEEEFLLVDPRTGAPVPRADDVMAAARGRFGLELDRELASAQVEVKTTVCQGLDQVRRELVAMRAAVAESAAAVGCRALAVGSPPLGEPEVSITAVPRYRRIVDDYGLLAHEHSVCGCHVHVEVPDRELAVQVCNHLRPWLPLLGAVTGNSPFLRGRDTGYTSWRSVVWSRWPAAGPPPYFTSWRHYESVCDLLMDSGAASDMGMVYWFVRPSSHLPTVEVRVADVAADVEETVLLTALVRALVTTALDDLARGVPAAPVPGEVLRLACWRAARDGLEGRSLDVLSDRVLPTRHLLGDLVRRVGGALCAAGDLETVARALGRLDRDGCGAVRQRRAFGLAGDPADLLDVVDVATRA